MQVADAALVLSKRGQALDELGGEAEKLMNDNEAYLGSIEQLEQRRDLVRLEDGSDERVKCFEDELPVLGA